MYYILSASQKMRCYITQLNHILFSTTHLISFFNADGSILEFTWIYLQLENGNGT